MALLSSKKEGYSIIIDNPEFSAAFQSLFGYLWEQAEEFKIKIK